MDPIPQKKIDQALSLSTKVGRMVLESGGETYRVEESIRHICCGMGFCNAQVMSIPTGVTIAIKDNGEHHASVERVQKRGVNLARLAAVNDISRHVSLGNLSYEQAMQQLDALEHPQKDRRYISMFSSGAAAAGFTLMFGGQLTEIVISFLAGFLAQAAGFFLGRLGVVKFISTMCGGSITAMIALIGTMVVPSANFQTIVTGAIMPLLPGLAITNAVREIIHGDHTSGVTRGTEALIVAVALVAGAAGTIAVITWIMGGIDLGIL